MEPRIPPRFVPTLTEVVALDADAEGLPPPGPQARRVSADFSPDAPQVADIYTPDAINFESDFAADMACRVLQHVQAPLQAQLAQAVEDLVRQHAQAMLAPLSEKIATVVRDAVAQAVRQELLEAGKQDPARSQGGTIIP